MFANFFVFYSLYFLFHSALLCSLLLLPFILLFFSLFSIPYFVFPLLFFRSWSPIIRSAILRNSSALPRGIEAPEATLCPPPLPPTAPAASLRANERSRPFETSSRVPLAEILRIPSDSFTQINGSSGWR